VYLVLKNPYKEPEPHPRFYTYKDYLEIPDEDGRFEIIHGSIYAMAAPSRRHQRVLQRLFLKFGNFLEGKKCEPFVAPFDVRLPVFNEDDEKVTNIVQPDIVVYCDPSKHDERGGKDTPDIVVEIISPSTGNMDRERKFNLYQLVGVKEYWIVDGEREVIEVYTHDGKVFSECIHYDEKSIITSTILEGFELQVSEIFP